MHIVQSPFLGKHFKDWIEEKKSDRISLSTQMNYVFAFSKFLRILEHLGKDLSTIEKVDVEDFRNFKKLIGNKKNKEFYVKSGSAQLFLVNVRSFLAWLNDKLNWGQNFHSVDLPNLNDKKKINPQDLITKDELNSLLRNANSPRDRCLIALLFETGARISEVLDIKIGDIQKHDEYMSLSLNGTKTKNSKRRVTLIESWTYIVEWLNSHPFGNDPNAYLFVNISKNFGKKYKYSAAYGMLKLVIKRAGLRHINPHLFRHTRATYDSKHMSPRLMNQKYGWEYNSKVPFEYLAASDDSLEQHELERHGILPKDSEENGIILKPKICPRCGKVNDSDARICQICQSPLDTTEILEKLDALTNLVATLISGKGVSPEDWKKLGIDPSGIP